ncbi:MAG: hypothetical protein ACR2JG_05010 [Geodermatophilaceae bacterium]
MVALLIGYARYTRENSIQRFNCRGDDDTLVWHRQVRDIVARTGGTALLSGMYDQLGEVISARANTVVVPSLAGAVHQTYQEVAAVLANDLDERGRVSAGG